jgi:uncharacterized protein YbaR (Trm112 family)
VETRPISVKSKIVTKSDEFGWVVWGIFMIDRGLLKSLVCPQDHTPLTMADGRLTAKLNRAISERRLHNLAGQSITQPVDGALVRKDKKLLYPIIDGIPVMLSDQAIPLDQIG